MYHNESIPESLNVLLSHTIAYYQTVYLDFKMQYMGIFAIIFRQSRTECLHITNVPIKKLNDVGKIDYQIKMTSITTWYRNHIVCQGNANLC